jgi:ADP-ribose pyrophosphatase YjhB (NUDIX family)
VARSLAVEGIYPHNAPHPPGLTNPMKFCSTCGQGVELKIPPGDHLQRFVCPNCGEIHYRNPKVIVGCIPEWEDGRIVMCKRNIEPRRGKWTFPAGFLELNETSGQGAAREAFEESLAEVEITGLLAVINVPYVSQVYVIHRARLLRPHCAPTPESSEVRLMREDEIPWDEIAFPTVWHSLKFFFADRVKGEPGFHELDLIRRPIRPEQAEASVWNPAT